MSVTSQDFLKQSWNTSNWVTAIFASSKITEFYDSYCRGDRYSYPPGHWLSWLGYLYFLHPVTLTTTIKAGLDIKTKMKALNFYICSCFPACRGKHAVNMKSLSKHRVPYLNLKETHLYLSWPSAISSFIVCESPSVISRLSISFCLHILSASSTGQKHYPSCVSTLCELQILSDHILKTCMIYANIRQLHKKFKNMHHYDTVCHF
jgi:hypothetical protein